MSATVCSACGLPPLPNKPLLKCTRCESVWYHDITCQVNHYPKHKVECRRVAKSKKKVNNTSTSVVIKQKPLVECRNIEGRGRSLFATTSLKIGCHPLSKSDGLCKPIAHPVLLESMRSSRCAYCFQQFKHGYIQSSELHYHCSLTCRKLDTNWKDEKHALQQLPSPPSPTALSCSRILRKFTETPSALNEYNELCYNIDSLSQQENESYLQIFNQAHIFLRAIGGDTTTAKMAYEMISNPAKVYQFMSRMCMNGFTISNLEQHSIGHGIYCGFSSTMNHSCRPNAVQTFWLCDNTPPMLQVTVCKNINVGEEITISYCDTSTPTSMRRATLFKNYKFICDCKLCKDIDRDDDVVGLKCTTNSGACKGRVKSINALNENENSGYQCNICKSTDFNKARKALSDFVDRMKQLKSLNNTQQHDKKVGDDIKKVYENLKQYCCMKSSYYLSSSADLYINWCANELKKMSNEQEQLKICHDALVVINKSRQVSQFIMDYPGNLSWSVKLGVEAKLRLFANPMDMEALQILQDVRKELLKYYPSSDDMILSLEESLAAYSFS